MSVELYTLDGVTYKQSAIFGKDDLLTVGIFPELKIDLTENIFKESKTTRSMVVRHLLRVDIINLNRHTYANCCSANSRYNAWNLVNS